MIRNLHGVRMIIKDVIPSRGRTWRTRPNMDELKAEAFDKSEIRQKDPLVDGCPQVGGFKEMVRVQVGEIDTPPIRWGTVGVVFLDDKCKKGDVHPVDFFESEDYLVPGKIR